MKEDKVGWEPREVGKKYMLDREYSHHGIVKVLQSGRIFATVIDEDEKPGTEWQVMVDRLTPVRDNDE